METTRMLARRGVRVHSHAPASAATAQTTTAAARALRTASNCTPRRAPHFAAPPPLTLPRRAFLFRGAQPASSSTLLLLAAQILGQPRPPRRVLPHPQAGSMTAATEKMAQGAHRGRLRGMWARTRFRNDRSGKVME